jgi:hypothetical protein
VGKLGVREKSLIHATPLMRGAGIDFPTLNYILVGNGSQWVAVPMTGDASILASGAITLAAGQRRYRGTASGTNTYTVTSSPAHTAYSAGDLLTITFTNANTGASTLNDTSLGAKAIQYKQAALTGGEIPAGATVELLFDGTQFQIVGIIGSSGNVAPDFVVYTVLGGAL